MKKCFSLSLNEAALFILIGHHPRGTESGYRLKDLAMGICNRLAQTRTTEVTWTVQLPEKFGKAIFCGIFQIPAIEYLIWV